MDDLISRQAAIDKVDRIVKVNHLNPDMVWFTPNGVKTLMEDLPSAEPNLQPTCNQLATDTISRQSAIDALRYTQHRFTVADEAGGIGTVKWSEDVIYFAAAEMHTMMPENGFVTMQKGESMRLIDADALKSRIERMWKSRQLTNTKYKTFIELLDVEPTIEPERGEWIETAGAGEPYPYGVRCSECGFCPVNLDNFCPNCGADMRGER